MYCTVHTYYCLARICERCPTSNANDGNNARVCSPVLDLRHLIGQHALIFDTAFPRSMIKKFGILRREVPIVRYIGNTRGIYSTVCTVYTRTVLWIGGGG